MNQDPTIVLSGTRPSLTALMKVWIFFSVCLAVIAVAAPLLAPSTFFGTVFNDAIQVFVALLVIGLFARNATSNHGHVRVFWILTAVAMSVWALSSSCWFISDIITHAQNVDIPLADAAVFFKTVLFMAALAIEPHIAHPSARRSIGLLDYLLGLVYWMYLYLMFVFAQSLLPTGGVSSEFRFQAMHSASNLLLVCTLGVVVLTSRDAWRRLYRMYFAAATLYCVAASFSNLAGFVGRHLFVGGSLDAFYLISLTAFGATAILGRSLPVGEVPLPTDDSSVRQVMPRRTFWLTRLAMLATLSVPLIGLWQIFQDGSVGPVRVFRVFCTLTAIFLMTMLLFFKQDLLNKSLAHSLDDATESYQKLLQFQDRLIQNEKLVSLGQFVANVANEIKKSMTSVIDYSSSITANVSGKESSRKLAAKINQYAGRTNSLAENMLSFAQETPLRMTPVDLKELLETALKLSRVQKSGKVRVEIIETGNCVPVSADSNQLLQVFLHVIANAADAIEEKGSGSLEITIRQDRQHAQISFVDDGLGIARPDQVFEPFYTTKPVGKGTGLGLSASHGIVRRHSGEITCCNRSEGGAVFTVTLPVFDTSDGLEAHPVPAFGGES
jgi:signal transduction histidine kinase